MRCPKCDERMNVSYSRKESGYTINTRICKKCNHKQKTIEMFYSMYVDSISKYNQILKIINGDK